MGTGLVFFGAVTGTQTGALAALEAFKVSAFVSTACSVITFLLVSLCASVSGLSGAVLGFVAASALSWLALHATTRRVAVSRGLPSRAHAWWREWRVLYRFSLPTFLGSAAVAPALWVSNALLVRQPSGYAELAVFSAADRWRLFVLFFPSTLSVVGAPLLDNFFRRRQIIRVSFYFPRQHAIELRGDCSCSHDRCDLLPNLDGVFRRRLQARVNGARCALHFHPADSPKHIGWTGSG